MRLRGLRSLAHYSWLERRMVLRAAIWLWLVDLGLRFMGFRRLIELARAVPDEAGPQLPEHIFMYTAALELASRYHPAPARCLHKSLVLHLWLRREGMPSELKIGVRKVQGELKAHAWVELAGCVINDDADAVADFKPLSRPDAFAGMAWTNPTA